MKKKQRNTVIHFANQAKIGAMKILAYIVVYSSFEILMKEDHHRQCYMFTQKYTRTS